MEMLAGIILSGNHKNLRGNDKNPKHQKSYLINALSGYASGKSQEKNKFSPGYCEYNDDLHLAKRSS